MATDNQRAPSVREQESVAHVPGTVAAIAKRIHDTRKPAIERQAPVVNNLSEACEELSLQFERLRAAHQLVVNEMNDCVVEASAIPAAVQESAYRVWISMMAVGDMLRDLNSLADGINDRALKERAA